MALSTAAVNPPTGLRIVRAAKGKCLVIAIRQQLSSPKTSNIAATLPSHDRNFWRRFSYTPLLLKISTIVRGLGLRQLNSGPGKVQFQHVTVSQLAETISEAVQILPDTLEELIDAAACNHALLRQEVTQILNRFGDEIWGAGKRRPWLLLASEDITEYQNNLVYESNADRDV